METTPTAALVAVQEHGETSQFALLRQRRFERGRELGRLDVGKRRQAVHAGPGLHQGIGHAEGSRNEKGRSRLGSGPLAMSVAGADHLPATAAFSLRMAFSSFSS